MNEFYRGLCFTEEAELMIENKARMAHYIALASLQSTASSTRLHLKSIKQQLDREFGPRFSIMYFDNDEVLIDIAWGTPHHLIIDLGPLTLISNEIH